MQTRQIEFFTPEKCRIIKQIVLVANSRNGADISIGYILYGRKFSDNYKINETDKEENEFKYFSEYPLQENYPTDNVDNILFQAIKNLYPKSFIRNYMLVCNLEQERIEILQSRPFEQSEIRIMPDTSQMYSFKQMPTNIVGGIWTVKIYVDYTRESIQGLAFLGYYDLNDQQILAQIDEVNFI